MSLNFFPPCRFSNLAIASWNCRAAWEYCLSVDEHVLDANLKISAHRGVWWWHGACSTSYRLRRLLFLTRANAQRMKARKTCVRQCVSLHLSNREVLVQHHGFRSPGAGRVPKVRKRECTDLPLWGLGKMLSSLYHLCDEELELCPPCQPLQSCHCKLEFCGCVEVTPSWSTNMFSMLIIRCLNIGMGCLTSFLFGPSARRFHSFPFSSVTSCDWTVCRYLSSFWSRPTMFVYYFFQSTFGDDHAFGNTIGSFRCDQWFSLLGTFCDDIQTVVDVLEHLFLHFVTCSRNYTSTFGICVPWSCAIVTRLALYCVWLWTFHEFQDCLVLWQCSWHPEKSLHVFFWLESVLPSVCPCWWLTKLTATICCSSSSANWSWSLVLGDQCKRFVLCHCYHATCFSVVFPCLDASGISELSHVWLHWVSFCSNRTVWACNVCDLRGSCIE